ncbi:MAG: hypothetical protein KKA26_01250, partial [Nanoarchaeota archaeon]|nr:hypothetical protein [Nanoarchaeota archaeon]
LDNLKIVLIGDLKNSRSAHSLLVALSFFENNEITLISPKSLQIDLDSLCFKGDIKIKVSSKNTMCDEDIIYMCGLVHDEYNPETSFAELNKYQITEDTIKKLKPTAIILCPLPRVGEIDVKVDKLPQAKYFKQSRNGLFVRMAIFLKMLREKEEEELIKEGKKILSIVMGQLRNQRTEQFRNQEFKLDGVKRYFMIPFEEGGEQPLFWLPTVGCSYARSKFGGCTMCNYGGAIVKLSDEILLRKFVETLEDPVIKAFPNLNYGGQGSFFDDSEHSPNLRKRMLEEVAKREWVKRFACESRPEFITEDKIKQMRDILDDKKIEIGLGLESTTCIVREGIINKNFNEEAYSNFLDYAKEFDLEISLDVMFKPNVLTEKEAIEDVVKTIKDILKDVDETHPIKWIILMVMNIKPNTLIEWEYKKGLYQPPLLWSVVEILKRLTNRERKFIKIAGFDSGIKPLKYATNEDETTNEFISVLKTFGSNHDFKLIEELSKKYFGSSSFKEWESRMNIKTEELSKRLEKFYELLKEEFKL